MSRKQFWRSAFVLGSFVLGVSLFVFLIVRQGPLEIIANIVGFGLIPFVGFVFISLTNFSLYSLRWRMIVNKHLPANESVPFSKIYMHRMAGYAVSYLTPAAQVGGEPVRIALLTQEKNVSAKQATSSVVLDISFELAAYALFILAGVVLAVVEGFGDANSLIVIFVGLGGLFLILVVFFALIARGKGFFSPMFRFLRLDRVKKLQRFESSIIETEQFMGKFLSGNRMLVVWISLLSILMISFRVVEVFYLAYFFGVHLDFGQAFLLSTLPGVALILPVPGGLGVFEGGFAALFAALLIPLNPVAFAFIIRGRDVIFILLGSAHLLLKGTKFVQNKVIDVYRH